MRRLLRRWDIGRKLILVIEIIISVTWTIVICRRLVIIAIVRVGLTVPSFATATRAFIRWWTRGTLSLRIWLFLCPLSVLKLLLLLVKLFLVSFVHILLLVLRLVTWTWLIAIILRSFLVSFVVSVILWLLFLIVLIYCWKTSWTLIVWVGCCPLLICVCRCWYVPSNSIILGGKCCSL
jgi:hypothetical protein